MGGGGLSSAGSARENARSLRHLISTEMWTHLNMFHNRMAILTLLAVHQHENEDYAEAILSWLVPAGVANRLSAYATLLAGTLTRSGHILPLSRLH